MAEPFLRAEYDAYSTPREFVENQRDREITEATELYLAAQDDPDLPGLMGKELEMPEPLGWLYTLRAWRGIYGQIPLRAGGLEDQPYRFTRDLEAALAGERKREAVKAVNLRNKMQYEASK